MTIPSAVLLDATVIRMVLVPAVMAVLGERNWYLPAWLRWLPDLWVEGTPRAQPPGPPATAGGEPAPVPLTSGGDFE